MGSSDLWMLLLLLAVLLLGAHGGTRLLDRLDAPRRRWGRSPRRRTDAVRPGERVCVVGELHPAEPGAALCSWVDGRPALVRDTYLMYYRSGSDEHDPWEEVVVQQSRPPRVMIRDESGEVPLLLEAGPVWLDCPPRRVRDVGMEIVDRFLAASGRTREQVAEGFPWGAATLPDGYELRERVLAPAAKVRACGSGVETSRGDPDDQAVGLAGNDDKPLYLAMCSERDETE